jgi:hypothetical protein
MAGSQPPFSQLKGPFHNHSTAHATRRGGGSRLSRQEAARQFRDVLRVNKSSPQTLAGSQQFRQHFLMSPSGRDHLRTLNR